MFRKRRLHPIAIFLLFLSALRELLIPIIATFIFGRGATLGDLSFASYFTIGGFLILFVYGYLKWLTFTYAVDDDQLIIKQGIFIKKERFIQKERIYSIDITSGVLQRLFRLVAVKIETAGGGNEPEVLLKAVTKQEALNIRKELLTLKVDTREQNIVYDKTDVFTQDDSHRLKWMLTTKDLLITSLTSTGVGIVFVALFTVFSQLEAWIPDEWMANTVGSLVHSSVVLIVIILILMLFLAWLISMVSTLLKYGGFTLLKKGDELEITRGIIERRQLTISVERITAIRVVESVLRQPFGFCTVYVESAGGGSKDEQLSTVLLPIVRKKYVFQLLQEIVPEVTFKEALLPLPKRARIRYVLRMLVPITIIVFLVTYFIPYGFLSGFLLPTAILYGNLQFKNGAIGKNQEILAISFRTISKTLVLIPKHRIQALEIKQSVIQQIRSLFTLQVSILSSIIGKSFQSVDISEQQKEELLTWYSYEES